MSTTRPARGAATPGRRAGDVQGDVPAEALRASEERFRGILESNPNGIVLVDDTGRIGYINEQAARLFGYPVREMVGMSVDTLVPDALAEGHRNERTAYLLEQAPVPRRMGFGRELTAKRADGSLFPVEIGLSSFTSQGRRFAVVVLADITDRKQTEADLRTTTENLQALVAASPLATLVLDLQGRVQLWNPAAEKVFGWTRDEVIGVELPHVPNQKRDEVRQILERVAGGEVISGQELHRQRKDGTQIDVELFAAPQRDSEGRVVAVIEQMADVTTRRQMEEALLQAQKMESIGRLAGGIAHDFNNMLTAISGFAQLLIFDLPEGTNERESAEAIRRAAGQAAELTQQLLAFSRRQVLEPKVIDPEQAVQGMEPMLRRLIGEDVDLRIVLRSNGARLRADPAQLEQVILNLAVNARDAMPEGGLLTIETAISTFDETYSSEHFAVSPGRYVMIAVSDTGMGMDAATKAHAFEPFFTTKERGKGTGLGLATIYGIVRQSGGHIWLYSEPDNGTTFKVYFPLVDDTAAPAEDVTQAPVGGNESILLVEDEDAVRDLARLVLERQGYRVMTAANAGEALEIVERKDQPIDLLVSDVVMPGVSGPELARQVRRIRPGIRTLFLSGYTEEMIGQRSRIEGADAFLSKPFTPQSLTRELREVLSKPPHD